MENIIIGTAGHVDHGKTCLIKVLSGIDTDRLKEEKKRGITIENGFANLPNDKGYHLGIIDVPGHEKFVKNMLAGIGGIDIVLLVISLEEGIKPQTIEHFEIIKSLGIKKGIIVFTKLDLENKVDYENLTASVKDLVKGSFLDTAKMIPVSSYTGQNIDLLKDTIYELASDISERRNEKELARLPIDRVFTMEGFGTVITGTLMEGKIDTSDELMLYPKMRLVKVRQIESHGKVSPSAFAGQRTAINLLNIKKEEIDRGDVLAYKSSIILSDSIECTLTMFKSASRKIKNGEKVHFNYGSAQTEAMVRVISDKTNINNGAAYGSLYVQFRFEKPIPVKRSDKYIIRFVSPTETCGGGIVLNVASKKRKLDDEYIKHFDILSSSDEMQVLNEMINDSSFDFPDIEYIARKMNKTINETKSLIEKLNSKNEKNEVNTNVDNKNNQNKVVIIGDIIISDKFYEGIKKYVIDVLTKFHKDNPISKGIKKEELKSILFKRYNKSGDTILEKLVDYFVDKKILKKIEDLVSLAEFNVVLDDKKSKDLAIIEKKYKDAGYEPPDTQSIVDEMAKGHPASYKLEIRQMILDLQKSEKLVKLSKEYYIHKDNFDKAINIMMKYFENHDKIMMKDLRDLLGTSRKYAILIIDYCDQKRITKLVDDYRILYKH